MKRILPIALILTLTLLTACESESPAPDTPETNPPLEETTAAPAGTSDTHPPETPISKPTEPATEPSETTAEILPLPPIPDPVTSSDGRFTAAQAEEFADLTLTDNTTGASIVVEKSMNSEMVNWHVPADPKFFGDKLYYKILGYEWFEAIGVYDCATGEKNIYRSTTMNYPLVISENAIITVAERGYYESYTVYSLASLEDSQIIETPFARRKKSPSSARLSESGDSIIVSYSDEPDEEIPLKSGIDPATSFSLRPIEAELSEKFPGIRLDVLRSSEFRLDDDEVTLVYSVSSDSGQKLIRAVVDLHTLAITDYGLIAPEESPLTSESGRFTASESDSGLFVTDSATGERLLVEPADLSDDAQRFSKPIPKCFVGETLYYNVWGWECYISFNSYDCETGEKRVWQLSSAPISVSGSGIYSTSPGFPTDSNDIYKVEYIGGMAVETNISEGKFPDLPYDAAIFDPENLRVGLILSDTLMIYNLY